VARINEILQELVIKKVKGNKAEAARRIGEKPQTFGNYLKERPIPADVIMKWKEEFGDDLLELARNGTSTNVSRETTNVSFEHKIFNGDYVGLHKQAWEEFQKTLRTDRKTITTISKNNTKLTDNNTKLTDKITELVMLLMPASRNKKS
jgi:plasmid maintenance system antidote protein VapI